MTIGLKQLAQAEPSANTTGGGTELSLITEDSETLLSLYRNWKSKGVEFLQPPTKLVFGFTFVAIDPDKHRIRVFTQNN